MTGGLNLNCVFLSIFSKSTLNLNLPKMQIRLCCIQCIHMTIYGRMGGGERRKVSHTFKTSIFKNTFECLKLWNSLQNYTRGRFHKESKSEPVKHGGGTTMFSTVQSPDCWSVVRSHVKSYKHFALPVLCTNSVWHYTTKNSIMCLYFVSH